ncbi:DedA family protein [Allonocardiopsis opalescens]|uniref:Membrane protein DedA with SNARE-associated domain n=1 Tax=Allonocardiopsis opalescens TaxID=1144618 RepID=A0A2T0PU06_9ACTN|nr:DedA family protein [Allonocardiopsis opalescens]PRX92381.1 membrane protein DedA with SNARE-associated domain [Allonocardiopsis opalescens]
MSVALPLPAAEPAPQSTEDLSGVAGWIFDVMDALGEIGVGIVLFAENIFPPIPSEAVLPLAGMLSQQGRMNFFLVVLAATMGALVGAWVLYGVGAALGPKRTRWLFEKMPLVNVEDFEKAERFFAKYGGIAVLFGRCVPIVRSLVSIPAGIERMPLWRFTLYTAIGSTVWNSIWIGLGFGLGTQWHIVAPYADLLSNAVLGIVALLVLWFVISRSISLYRGRRAGCDAGGPDAAEPRSHAESGDGR